MRKKIVSLSMREQMYDALRDLILRNSYAPGCVLQIDRLAEEFGVSATPVREALVRLEAERLVDLIPNKGAVVTSIMEADIRNNWEMRKLLEPYAAAASAFLIPGEEIDRIQAEVRSLLDAPFDNDRYVSSDNNLHEILYVHLVNTFLKETIRRVHQMSIRIRYYPEGSATSHERAVSEVIREHLDIVDTLRTRDPERIRDVVRTHLQNGERRAIAAFGGVRKEA